MRTNRVVVTGIMIASFVCAVAAPAMAELPKAKKVISRYIKAIGGEKALRQMESVGLYGTFAMPDMGMEGELSLLRVAGGYRLDIELPGYGTVSEGYIDGAGWSDDPMQGTSVMSGDRLAAAAVQADLHAELHYDKHYSSMSTVEQTEFAGVDCYAVELVSSWGDTQTQYFEVESGLLRGSVGMQPVPDGKIEITTTYGEYVAVGDVLMPKELTQTSPMGKQVMTVSRTSVNELSKADIAPSDAARKLISEAD